MVTLEALEHASVDVVGVDVGHDKVGELLVKLEAESLSESSEGELGCTIVAPLAESLAPADRINVHDVELALLSRVLHGLLVGKKFSQLHDRHEVDVHGLPEGVDGDLAEPPAQGTGSVVDQDVHPPMLVDYLFPGGIQGGLVADVNVDVLDGLDARIFLELLDSRLPECRLHINDHKLNILMLGGKLFGEKLPQALSATC